MVNDREAEILSGVNEGETVEGVDMLDVLGEQNDGTH